MHKAHQVSEPPAHGVHCIAEHTARGRVELFFSDPTALCL